MQQDMKRFDTAVAAATPRLAPHATTPAKSDPAAEAARERREQDKVLAVMLCGVVALVLAVWIWGGSGLLGWALTMTGLAGVWIVYTTRGIRTSADD